MKLSKDDIQRAAKLMDYYRNYNYFTIERDHMKFFIDCFEILTSKPHRFTYEMRDCKQCDGVGEVGASMNQFACDVEKCKACGGLGKIRTKVARK